MKRLKMGCMLLAGLLLLSGCQPGVEQPSNPTTSTASVTTVSTVQAAESTTAPITTTAASTTTTLPPPLPPERYTKPCDVSYTVTETVVNDAGEECLRTVFTCAEEAKNLTFSLDLPLVWQDAYLVTCSANDTRIIVTLYEKNCYEKNPKRDLGTVLNIDYIQDAEQAYNIGGKILGKSDKYIVLYWHPTAVTFYPEYQEEWFALGNTRERVADSFRHIFMS